MFKTLEVTLDTERSLGAPQGQIQSFAASTNDYESVKIVAKIIQDKEPVDLSGATVKLAIAKPDKNVVFQNGTVTFDIGGECEFVLETQSYNLSGQHLAEVMIYFTDGKIVTTRPFAYQVIRGILNDGAVASTSWYQDINELQQLVADLEIGLNEQINQAMVDATADATQAADLANQRVVELDGFETSITSQLADKAPLSLVEEKRDKAAKITPLDVSDDLLQMFSPAGTVSPVVTDNSISYQKTTFLKPGKNLFNKATRTIGFYTASADGQLKNDITGYDSTDYMLVDGGQSYVLSHTAQWAEYDANKAFLVGHPSTDKMAVLNASTKYVRVSILQANVDAFQFEKASVSTAYEPFQLRFKPTTVEPIKILDDGSVTPETTSFMSPQTGKNKLPLSVTIVPDQLPTETTVSAGAGAVSFLLPCEPGKAYTISRQVAGTRFRAAYTDTATLVTSTTPLYGYVANDAGTSITLLPNENAAYIFCYFWRVADQGEFTPAGLESIQLQVEEGYNATAYEPYAIGYRVDSTYLPSTSAESDDDKLSGKVSILGDSISTFDGYIPAGNRTRYPQSNLLMDVNQTWWKRFLDNTGMTLGVNNSWAGSRVSWDGTTESEDIGANKHMASDARINSLDDNGTPNLIFFFGGTNDISGGVPLGTFSETDFATLPVNTFAAAYRTTIIKLQTRFPSARIVCLSPMYSTSNYTEAQLDDYIEVMKEICDFFGVVFIDLRKSGITTFNKATYFGDGLHPNAEGMRLMNKYMSANVIPLLK